ncbi:hypothetical protein ACWDTP_00300 [Mycobacterium sp. NPDC003449]
MNEAVRRARREVVRRHHPDVGGSAEELIAALAALDGSHAGWRRPAVRVQRTWRGHLANLAGARRRRIRRRRAKLLLRR